jgi:hypothetical protein
MQDQRGELPGEHEHLVVEAVGRAHAELAWLGGGEKSCPKTELLWGIVVHALDHSDDGSGTKLNNVRAAFPGQIIPYPL